jgi:hypothetical protein
LLIGHFTASDIIGCFIAVFAFIPFLLAPGFCTAYFLDLFQFRDAHWPERWLVSIIVSVAITPSLAATIARVSSLTFVCWMFVAMTVVAFSVTFLELRNRGLRAPARSTRIGMTLLVVWVVIAIASLVDVQVGHSLYPTAASFDQALRAAVTAGVVRTGVPPANPFFYPGHPVAMRYYYYWYVVCAMPAKLFGISPRVTMLASVVWSGFAIASLIPVFLKHFCEETVDLGRKSLIGIGLLCVTGLDIIPTIRYTLSQHTMLPDMEWWDWTQVTSWFDSLIWVPHHVAGVVACMSGFLVLWVLPRHASASERAKAVLIAALAFASAAGLSVYVTFTFAIFLTVWGLVLLRSHLGREVLTFIAAGVLAVLLSIGYLHDLRQPGISGNFATFYVRALSSIQDWSDDKIPWTWVGQLFLAAMLPVYYALELGFFAFVGLLQGWRYWRRPAPLLKWEWAAVCLCGVSLLVGSFLMSSIGNNDLGYRAVLFAQLVLLIWAVPVVYRWTRGAGNQRLRSSFLLRTFLWIGVIGTVYQAVELRAFSYLADHTKYTDDAPWLPHGDAIGQQIYDIRSGYEQLNQRLPSASIVQYNPLNPAYVPNLAYSLHQAIAGEGACGTAFGGNPFECLPYQRQISNLFSDRKAVGISDAEKLCRDLGIDVLVAERSDRMWALRKSWVWTGPTIVATPSLRAIACGAHGDQTLRRFGLKR